MRRRKETFRDLDIIATATDPPALIDVLHAARRGSSRSSRTATRRRPCSRTRACASTCASCRPSRYGNLLQHFTGSKDHNVALREEARAARALDLRVRRHDGRDRRGVHDRGRGRALRVPRLPVHPARAARERAASSRRRGSGELPELVELARPARRPAHAHDLVGGRQEHARGDGRAPRRRAATSTTPITDHSHYLRDGRLARAARGDRGAARAVPEAAHPRGRRGEHPLERRGSTSPRTSSPALDWVVASVHDAPQNEPDRARARGDGEPVRRLHRPPDRPPDQQARAARRRRRARDREGARGRLRPRDQRRSPTGSTCATCTRALRRRRG